MAKKRGAKAKPPDRFDVVVAGGGPAGATAAIILARKNRRVALIDRRDDSQRRSVLEWIGHPGVRLLHDLGIDAGSVGAVPIREVRLHRADFSRSAEPRFPDPPGVLVDRRRLEQHLLDLAAREGATCLTPRTITDVFLEESGVRVPLEGADAVRGNLLILAAGGRSPLLERIDLPTGPAPAPFHSARVEQALPGEAADSTGRVELVLGLGESGGFGVCGQGAGRVFAGIQWFGEAAETLAQLEALCAELRQRDILPVDLAPEAAQARIVPSPAGRALDMESHVGKHTLVVGDAGGFVAPSTGEGIYPAMWSARIAAEVVHKALQSEHSQDALMEFDTAWRKEMAEYLRPLQTDIQFLLPLVFSNQAIADRMGRVFFFGENM